jgi:hypothetical protein
MTAPSTSPSLPKTGPLGHATLSRCRGTDSSYRRKA